MLTRQKIIVLEKNEIIVTAPRSMVISQDSRWSKVNEPENFLFTIMFDPPDNFMTQLYGYSYESNKVGTLKDRLDYHHVNPLVEIHYEKLSSNQFDLTCTYSAEETNPCKARVRCLQLSGCLLELTTYFSLGLNRDPHSRRLLNSVVVVSS